MRTYPLLSDEGISLGFEIDDMGFLAPIVDVLERVEGVTQVRKRRCSAAGATSASASGITTRNAP